MGVDPYQAGASDILANINNPNVDHSNVQSEVQNLNITFVAIICAVVILRIAVRGLIVQHVALEDYFMIVAALAAVALSGVVIYGVSRGFGKHIWDLPLVTILEDVKICIQIFYVCQILYATALCMVKLSIISTYLRVFPRTWMRRSLYVLAFAVTSIWLTLIFATIFQCHPISGAWDFTVDRHCISIANLNYFTSSFSIFSDVLLCVLPIPLIRELSLPRREKYMLAALFGIGLLAAAATAVRITTIKDIGNLDFTIRAMPALNWSIAEVATGIICACIPCLKPLIRAILPGHFFHTTYHHSHTAPSGNGAPQQQTTVETVQTSQASSPRFEHRATLSKSGTWRGRGVSWYQKPPSRDAEASWYQNPPSKEAEASWYNGAETPPGAAAGGADEDRENEKVRTSTLHHRSNHEHEKGNEHEHHQSGSQLGNENHKRSCEYCR